MNVLILVFQFIIGLVIGSFLGAFTYRFPRGTSIGEGRSKCPDCKNIIFWYDNIPLFSYLFLHGKCRNCKNIISYRYPIIELSAAIVFVFIGFNLINLVIASILIAIFVIDVEYQLIFDEFIFVGLLIVLSSFIFLNNQMVFSNILSGFIASLLLLSLNLITKGKGMGLGDVKLALFLGPLIGIDLFLNWLFFSFLAGAIVGIVLIIGKKATMKQKIAFGPFLIIGLVLALLIK